MSVLTLRKADVPAFLHESDFYLSLSDDENDEFTIPRCCFKSDTSFTDENSFRNLLSTMRFWGVKSIPSGLYNKVLDTARDGIHELAEEFGNEFRFLCVFSAMQKNNWFLALREAAHWGDLEFIQYLLTLDYFQQCGFTFCVIAAERGHISVLKHFRTANYEGWDGHAVRRAAANGGKHDCFVFASDGELTEEQCAHYKKLAMERGCFEIVRYLHHRGIPLTAQDVQRVNSSYGVRLIHDSGLYDWSRYNMSLSLPHAGMDVLITMNELGCPFTREVLLSPRFVQSTVEFVLLFSLCCLIVCVLLWILYHHYWVRLIILYVALCSVVVLLLSEHDDPNIAMFVRTYQQRYILSGVSELRE